MKAIYRFSADCGRMGSLEGIFVADSDEVASILGETIDFGEALGKHSEVVFDIEEGMIENLTEDQQAVEMFEKFDLTTGYNPFAYYETSEETEDE